MGFKVIDEITEDYRALWKKFVDNHPSGTIFQTPEFSDLFDDAGKQERVFIGILDDSGKMLALVFAITLHEYAWIKRNFASRTVIYGGPLVDPDAANPHELLGLLLETLINKVNKTSLFIEFRNFEDSSAYKELFRLHGFNYYEHLNLFINTRDRNNVQSSISKSKLRQIRKSLAAGAIVKLASTQEEIKEFYELLKDLYRKKVRKPVPSIEFFQKFYSSIILGKLGIILLVKYQEKVVAGMVCPITPGQAIYEWYVCRDNHKHREIFPGVLITWAAIDYATKNNIPRFDFMGMGKPGKEYGVRYFKSGFGGERINYGRFIRVNNKFNYFIARIGFYILGLFKKA
jgi:serine/alanine adding enzyme